MSNHTHHMRVITAGRSYHNYECLDCGRRYKALVNGSVIVARTPKEADAYLNERRKRIIGGENPAGASL